MVRVTALLVTCCSLILANAAGISSHEFNDEAFQEINPANYVNINGTMYYFGTEGAYLDFYSADAFCKKINMTVTGMETFEEWDRVISYMHANGLGYYYWTSGRWLEGGIWIWAYSGVRFSDNDPRWDKDEPGQDTQGVTINVSNGALWSENFNIVNHVICEDTSQIPPPPM